MKEPNQERLILEAAIRLTQRKGHGFKAADLVVETWKKNPDEFGLAGYEKQYPDSNRVISKLYGVRGMLRSGGPLTKLDALLFCLTADVCEQLGIPLPVVKKVEEKAVKEEGEEGVVIPASPAIGDQLTPGQEYYLEKVFQSEAWNKYRAGRTEQITYEEASAFWGLSDEYPVLQEAYNRIDLSRSYLREAIAHCNGSPVKVLKCGMEVSVSDLADAMSLLDQTAKVNGDMLFLRSRKAKKEKKGK